MCGRCPPRLPSSSVQFVHHICHHCDAAETQKVVYAMHNVIHVLLYFRSFSLAANRRAHEYSLHWSLCWPASTRLWCVRARSMNYWLWLIYVLWQLIRLSRICVALCRGVLWSFFLLLLITIQVIDGISDTLWYVRLCAYSTKIFSSPINVCRYNFLRQRRPLAGWIQMINHRMKSIHFFPYVAPRRWRKKS